jgi:hypothetical protein
LAIHPHLAIFQDHLIYNLSTEDASPPRKMVVGTAESFVGHDASTTMTLHPEPPKRLLASLKNISIKT